MTGQITNNDFFNKELLMEQKATSQSMRRELKGLIEKAKKLAVEVFMGNDDLATEARLRAQSANIEMKEYYEKVRGTLESELNSEAAESANIEMNRVTENRRGTTAAGNDEIEASDKDLISENLVKAIDIYNRVEAHVPKMQALFDNGTVSVQDYLEHKELESSLESLMTNINKFSKILDPK